MPDEDSISEETAGGPTADGGDALVARTTVRESEGPTVATVRAIAAATDVRTTDVETLYRSIATDALDDLFRDTASSTRRGTVTFTASGFEVTVRDGETVELRTATLDEESSSGRGRATTDPADAEGPSDDAPTRRE